MTRIVRVVAISAFLFLATWAPAANAECCGRLIGDVNCDTSIDSRDARDVLKYHVGFLEALGCFGNSNVDGDWAVTSIDSLLILKFQARLIDHLPPVKTFEGTIINYRGIEGDCLALDTGDDIFGVWDLGTIVVGDRVRVVGYITDKVMTFCGVTRFIMNSYIEVVP